MDGGGELYVEPILYPNFYRITQPLVFNQVGGGGKHAVDIVGVKGEDVHGSVIRGNFAGFVFDNSDTSSATNLSRVHGLMMYNDNPNGGCIRHDASVTGEIAHCRFSAKYGVWCDSNSYNCVVRNCDFIGPNFNPPGSIGLIGHRRLHNDETGDVAARSRQICDEAAATQTTVLNNSFTNWETGLMSGNVGMTVQGNRFEVNNLGLNIGGQFPAISWNNGIVTVTVSKPLTGYFGAPLAGTKQIKLENVNVNAYNGYHTCTILELDAFYLSIGDRSRARDSRWL